MINACRDKAMTVSGPVNCDNRDKLDCNSKKTGDAKMSQTERE